RIDTPHLHAAIWMPAVSVFVRERSVKNPATCRNRSGLSWWWHLFLPVPPLMVGMWAIPADKGSGCMQDALLLHR
ncbi:MAG: hypothetical protein ACTHQE_10750, partial [Thermomicrobiales bacterium]